MLSKGGLLQILTVLFSLCSHIVPAPYWGAPRLAQMPKPVASLQAVSQRSCKTLWLVMQAGSYRRQDAKLRPDLPAGEQ